MRGIVKVIKNGKVWESSPNMILDGMGSIMADAMVVSPSLSAISSASAILDASNYTIQAISFGKDARGYYNHAHSTPDYVLASSVIDHIIRVKVPDGGMSNHNVSSYITSDVTVFSKNFKSGEGFSSVDGGPYKLLPEASNPVQTKLEQGYQGVRVTVGHTDREHIGHNPNKLWVNNDVDVPGSRELYGCYPSASGTKYYLLSSWDNADSVIGRESDLAMGITLGASGTAYSTFNNLSSMDRNGFVKLATSGAHATRKIAATAPHYYGSVSGLAPYAQDDFSSTGRVQYISTVSGGDLLFAGLFGGIYTLGLWAIDIKETIMNGVSPPFNFSYLDNKIKYKLVARKTFTRDLTFIHDYLTYSGYKFLENKNSEHATPLTDNNHLIIQWELAF